jgi:Matrixin
MSRCILATRLGAAGAVAAILLFSRQARSFCRTVTRLPPAGWNVTAQGCFVDDAAGAKALFWKNSCVGYSLHKNASRLFTLEQATAVVAAAFEAWSSAGCAEGGQPSMNAVNLGPVDCGRAQYNRNQANQNVIVFHDEQWPHGGSDKTLGLTTVTFDTMTGELVGADMEINATQNLVLGDDVPAGVYSLASVITHEVGHFLGLAHSAETSAVMFAQYKETARLAADDAEGLCAMYQPGGSRVTTDGVVAGASCDPTPRGGFISACTPPPDTSDTGAAQSDDGCSVAGNLAGRRIASPAVALGMAWLALTRRRAGARAMRTRMSRQLVYVTTSRRRLV